MKNKGFTLIEVMFSFAITVVIIVMLLQIVLMLKELYVASTIKTEMLNKQAIISKKINTDLNSKFLKAANKCGANCINFIFDDGTVNELSVDKTNNTFTYGKYKTKLVDGSYFGDIYVASEIILVDSVYKKNSLLTIDIPIKHNLVKKNYGINIAYQYNSNEASLSDIIFDDNVSKLGTTYIVGNAVTVAAHDVKYIDSGVIGFDENGKKLDKLNVKVINPFKNMELPYNVGDYNIKYDIMNDSNVVIKTLTRKVEVIKEEEIFKTKNEYQTFKSNTTGKYIIEVWGAVGGSYDNSSIGGKGGYSKGEITLNKGQELYVYVGSKGSASNVLNVSGGYNGGGNGSYYGGSGGGSTDVRTINGSWDNVASLNSRIIVAAGGGGANGRRSFDIIGNGGYGGGTIGGNGTYTDATFNGKGATLSAGGAVCTGSNTGTPTAGLFGKGGNAGYYNTSYGAGGGGGGYYGGGGGCERYGGGGGGSSYIGTFENAKTIAGNASMPTYDGLSTMIGNQLDGYAKITYLSSIN